MNVKSVNDRPVANSDSLSVKEGESETLNLINNDTDIEGDALRINQISSSDLGSISISSDGNSVSFDANSSIVNTLKAGEVIEDTITYNISDGDAVSEEAEINIAITGVNDAPEAFSDSAQTNKNESVSLNVILNDKDIDGDSLTVTGVTQGEKGVAELLDNGLITYTPNPKALSELNDGEEEADSFSYTVSDGKGGVVEGSVNLSILGINDAPVALTDAVTITSRTKFLTIDVLENDFDPDSASANDIISIVDSHK